MTDTERLAALLKELDPLAVSMDDLAARLVAAGVRVGYPDLDVERDEFGFHDIPVPDSVVDEAPDGLGVERVAAFLHDEYGCRVTCRGGRLADDRHPSHNEAYRGQAERLVAAARVGIDPDRLARALAWCGMWRADKAETLRNLAAAIVKAYEEEG